MPCMATLMLQAHVAKVYKLLVQSQRLLGCKMDVSARMLEHIISRTHDIGHWWLSVLLLVANNGACALQPPKEAVKLGFLPFNQLKQVTPATQDADKIYHSTLVQHLPT